VRLKALRSHFVFHWTLILISVLPIGSFAEAGKSALVIIDMQPYFVTRNGVDQNKENQEKVNQMLQAELDAIKAAKAAQVPILFVEYEARNLPLGSTYDVLKDTTKDYQNVTFIKKTSDGMFDDYNSYKEKLVQFLTQNNIRTLIITGANGGACVEASIKGALKSNYSVVSYSNAIADFNFMEFKYPYHYAQMPKDCSDCTFREVANLSELFPSNGNLLKSKPDCGAPYATPGEKTIRDLYDNFGKIKSRPMKRPKLLKSRDS